MRCAWQEFLQILPPWMRQQVDRHGKDTLQELRLREGLAPQLLRSNGPLQLEQRINREDLSYVVNAASRYSPWSAASAAKGYLTAPGGHRIGLCGEAIINGGTVTGIRTASSLCLRVARDIPGIAAKATHLSGSMLIIGPPGAGKTTLLRDLIRSLSDAGPGSIAVVDERGELFPKGFAPGPRTDVLTGCGKRDGIDMLLRTMGPAAIAVDEITSQADCEALVQAGWCGVRLLATAHAADLADLRRRSVYRPLLDTQLFDTVLVLHRDKSWHMERMCTYA